MKFGQTELKLGLMLAPMAGVTDQSFRLICRKMGAEYTVSEMVSAKAMCYEQKSHRKESVRSVTAALAAVTAEELPMAVQLFGSEPDLMAEAAAMIEAGSYRGCLVPLSPTAIDLNMGCPMRKITGNGEGSALMRDPKLAEQIVGAVKRAVSIPVTVKMRAGWDSQSINAPELAKRLEAAGADWICVHARTREQLYSPGIDLTVIERTKAAVSIPVVGNGDIASASDARRMLQQTGCDGIMIGRGAMGNPWIFSEIRADLEGKPYTPPTEAERIATASGQLDAMLARKGDRIGLAEAKKHMAWYVSGMKGAAEARFRLMKSETADDMKAVMRGLLSHTNEEKVQ